MIFINFYTFFPNSATFFCNKPSNTRRCNKQLHNTTQYDAISAIKYRHSIGQMYFQLSSLGACAKALFNRSKADLCMFLHLLAGGL